MDRDPATLSAGEQQMVQIARALVRVPDRAAARRAVRVARRATPARMRAEIAMLQSGYGVTTLMATNDSADVEALAGRSRCSTEGRLVQFGATAAGPALTGEPACCGGDRAVVADRDDRDRRAAWVLAAARRPAGGELVTAPGVGPGARAPMLARRSRSGVRPEDVEIDDAGRFRQSSSDRCRCMRGESSASSRGPGCR